jgi:hypothetical protein
LGGVILGLLGLPARGEAFFFQCELLFFQFEDLFFQIVSFSGALFGGLLAFLRFEANLLLSPLGSYILQFLEGFVEGPFVGGLVAQVEGELFGGDDVLIFKDAALLEAESAGAEPFVVGQALDENTFGFGLGLMFFGEPSAEIGKFLRIFVVEKVERLVAVLAETVSGAIAG